MAAIAVAGVGLMVVCSSSLAAAMMMGGEEETPDTSAGAGTGATGGSYGILFHHGNYDTANDTYNDGSRAAAAEKGHVYADTTASELPSSFGTCTATMTDTETTYSWTPPASGEVDILVVGGGGGGGTSTAYGSAGGGGGGDVLTTTKTIESTTYTIKVGNGGAPGQDGTQSAFGTDTADPGKKGVDSGSSIGAKGGASGSGLDGGAKETPPSGTSYSARSSGGGGGAGAVGKPGLHPVCQDWFVGGMSGLTGHLKICPN